LAFTEIATHVLPVHVYILLGIRLHLYALTFILGSLFTFISVKGEKFKHPLLEDIHIAQMSRGVNKHLLVIAICQVIAVISILSTLVLKVLGKSRHVA
jgi:archaellum biogenesis protein FlaJ (TadC family)